MRHYEAPRLVYSIFSHENIITTSEPEPPKTNLNEWLSNEGAEDYSNHVVVNMAD